ncbi:hypothetical protein LUZ60_007987 [Juncus effusus]|nr:hypothetical protein LUZ60_007987 [Juncus effusus]
MKNTSVPNIISGIQRLIKGFKSISQLFELYREEDEEEMISDIQIGFPTDVQHVAHIGLDGSENFGTKSWDGSQDLFSLSTLSFNHFELGTTSG